MKGKSESLTFVRDDSGERRLLVVVGVEGGGFVGEEMGGVELGLYELERAGRLGEVETVGEVVGEGVGVAEGAQIVLRFDELQQAAEIVGDMRNVGALGVG